MIRALHVVALVTLAAACVEPNVTQCSDGIVCPAESVCSPRGGCVAPQQLAQCNRAPDDGLCTLPDGMSGGCFDGVCLPRGCGNGITETDEVCDDGNKLGNDGCSATCRSDERCGNGVADIGLGEGCDCGDASFTGERPPGCNGLPNSSDPNAICTPSCLIRGCGDGVREGLEDCDGSDQLVTACDAVGYYQGALGCLATCRYDTAACVGRCGDGERNGPDAATIEDCDGADLNGQNCTTFGFYVADGLACNALCGIDTTACSGSCGDGAYDAGFEPCDATETSTDLAGRGLDCTDLGYYAAAGLACTSSCLLDETGCRSNGGGYCGDGVKQVTEDCDGGDVGTTTCTQFGYYATDGLACRSNCTFDVAGCMGGRCGDAIVDAPEQCDGSVPTGMACTNFGFYPGGVLTCNAACALDTIGCTGGYCGDTLINGGEACDGSVPAGTDCTTFGFYSDAGLACSTGCTFSTADCGGICGDGIKNGPEQCDELDLGSAACTDFGFYAPTGLACTAACGLDDFGCRGTCGDNLVNGPESCDGAPPLANACAYAGWDAGQLNCASTCSETFENCRRLGVDVEVVPTGSSGFRDIWGTGDDLFVVGNSAMRRSGGTWLVDSLSRTFNAVWGLSATEVFAVGQAAAGSFTIYRFDGGMWSSMAGPAMGVTLNDVWGSSADNVWAVGRAVSGGSGRVLHYNGISWSDHISPTAADVDLEDVWGTAPDNVFVTGRTNIIYQWTGTMWVSHTPVPVTAFASAIGGRGADDVYVGTTDGVVWHYNGATWTSLGACVGGGFATVRSIIAVPGGALFILGEDSSEGYICQRAGGAWQRLPTPSLPALFGMTFTGTEIYAAGGATLVRTSTANWLPTREAPADSNASWADLWGTATNNMYAVGQVGGVGAIRRYTTGPTWESVTVTSGAPLQAITGGTGWAVAVGRDRRILASNGTGGAWTTQSSTAVNQHLRAVWGADGGFVHAVGDNGVTLRRATTGTTWTSLTPVTTFDLNSVWGASDGTVFAVGANGTIVRYTGGATGSWLTMPSPTSAELTDVWGRSATDVYAAGASGTVLHYNGSSWSQIPTGLGETLDNLSGTAGDLFVTTPTALLQYVGGRWLPVRMPVFDFAATAMWSTSEITVLLRDRTTSTTDMMLLAGRIFSPAATETACDDFWDDDEDGLVDCADPQCAAAIECSAGGGCQPVIDLACGASDSGTTIGGATRWPAYGTGCSNRDESGREAFYRVRRATAGPIEVTVTGLDADLDLVVSAMSASGACLPDEACLASDQDDDVTSPSVSFAATAATDYIVIVDGFAGATSDFTIQVTCP